MEAPVILEQSRFHLSIRHGMVVGWLQFRLRRWESRRLQLFGLRFLRSGHSRTWAERRQKLDIGESPERSVARLRIHQSRMSVEFVTLSTFPHGVSPTSGAQRRLEDDSMRRLHL